MQRETTDEEKDEVLVVLLEAGSYCGEATLHFSDMLAAQLRVYGIGCTNTTRLVNVGKTLGWISPGHHIWFYAVGWGVVLKEARDRGLLIIKS
jgi:hypothetical protein